MPCRNAGLAAFFRTRTRHFSRDKKAAQPPSSATLRPVKGASSIASGLSIAIEAAIGAVPRDRQESTMEAIGTLTRSGNSLAGAVKTLSINAKTLFKPADKASDKAPGYRIS